MRRIVLFLMAATVLAGCAKPAIVRQELAPGRILPLAAYSGLSTPAELNASAFYLDAGDTFPLKVTLESAWIASRQDQIELVARQRIYLRVSLPPDMTGERFARLMALDQDGLAALSEAEKEKLFAGTMIHASKDAVEWAPLNDQRALKQVFGIQGGTLSLGAAVSATEGMWLSIIVRAEPSAHP